MSDAKRTPAGDGQHEQLGTALREARELRGLSLRAAASRAGISNTYLSQLEAGAIKEPSPHVLFNLAEVCGVPYATLMRLAGYVVPKAEASAETSSPLDVALQSTSPLSSDERAALVEYLAWFRSRHGRPPEKP